MESSFSWKDKKVLVLGGTGFLGMHLCQWLLSQKACLTVFDFREPSTLALFDFKNVDFKIGDIRNKDDLRLACKDKDIVFHLAAIPSIARETQKTYFDINVQGTENVLSACYEKNVSKVVYVSSSTVYGIPLSFPCKENSLLAPIGKYGQSKIEAENLCHVFSKKGLDISIIRPRVIMGAGRMGIFSILFSRVYANKAIFLVGSGDNIFQFTGVSDMVNACRLAAQHSGSDIFNIGSDDSQTVYEIMKNLIQHAKKNSRIIPLSPFLVRISLQGLEWLGMAPLMNEQYRIADKNFKLDTTKAKQLLGWSPKENNSSCLISAYDWFEKHHKNVSPQYKTFLSVIGKFKRSHQSAFQK